jgi:hypothetical protein
MYMEIEELKEKYSLDAATIAYTTGVLEKTAEKWLARTGEFPIPALRVLLLVNGEVKPEDFRA